MLMLPIWLLSVLLELVTFQVTAVLEAPVTVAVNCFVPPKAIAALVGEMVTLTFVGGGVTPPPLLPPPPHPAAASARSAAAPQPINLIYFIGSPCYSSVTVDP